MDPHGRGGENSHSKTVCCITCSHTLKLRHELTTISTSITVKMRVYYELEYNTRAEIWVPGRVKFIVDKINSHA